MSLSKIEEIFKRSFAASDLKESLRIYILRYYGFNSLPAMFPIGEQGLRLFFEFEIKRKENYTLKQYLWRVEGVWSNTAPWFSAPWLNRDDERRPFSFNFETPEKIIHWLCENISQGSKVCGIEESRFYLEKDEHGGSIVVGLSDEGTSR